MASKQRLIDLENRFGLSSAFLSDVTLSLVRSLHAQWFSLLFCAKQCFTAERLQAYARAITDKVFVLTGNRWPVELSWMLVAFLDGSFLETERPSDEIRLKHHGSCIANAAQGASVEPLADVWTA